MVTNNRIFIPPLVIPHSRPIGRVGSRHEANGLQGTAGAEILAAAGRDARHWE